MTRAGTFSSQLIGWFMALFGRLARAFVDYHGHAPFRIRAIAWLGAVTLPLYYFVWAYVFPQPYENLPLRLVGGGLCLTLALSPYWPAWARPYYYPFVYAVLIFTLPMFFTFMLLMNQMSVAWQMSTVIALLFVALLFDTANTAVAVMVGIVFGLLAYLIWYTGPPLTWQQVENVPVIVFALVAIRILLSYNDRFVADEKMRAARTLAGHIAHEMRTPLLGIQLDAGKARQYMPALRDALKFARAHGWQGQAPRAQQLELLGQSMDRIREHANSAGLIVDMLLFNARHDSIDKHGFAPVSIAACLDKAIERYHFRTGERDKLRVELINDFQVVGSDVMLVHVFFNLLKNALRAVEPDIAGRVSIRIDSKAPEAQGRVAIADTGTGIPKPLLRDLFTAFRTTSSAGNGSGLGLAFCKLAIESSGGQITVVNVPNSGAEFTMTFPIATDPPAAIAPDQGRSPVLSLASIASITGNKSATVSTT